MELSFPVATGTVTGSKYLVCSGTTNVLVDVDFFKACSVAKIVRTAEESKALNRRKGPMIIIAGSGMATGGRVVHHLKAFAPDSRNTILFAGFQAEGTRGAAMLNGAESIKIYGEYVLVLAEIGSIDSLSAHADYVQILAWLKKMKRAPRQVLLRMAK